MASVTWCCFILWIINKKGNESMIIDNYLMNSIGINFQNVGSSMVTRRRWLPSRNYFINKAFVKKSCISQKQSSTWASLYHSPTTTFLSFALSFQHISSHSCKNVTFSFELYSQLWFWAYLEILACPSVLYQIDSQERIGSKNWWNSGGSSTTLGDCVRSPCVSLQRHV